jgi:hypothetical protein
MGTSSSRNRSRHGWGLPELLLVLLPVLYVVLLYVGFRISHWADARNLGIAGDYMGGVANVVAMIGIAVALSMQWRDLRIQRQGLDETRLALTEQLKLSREAHLAEHLVVLHKVMLDDDFRQLRGKLFGIGPNRESWKEGDSDIVEKACAHWNYVAILLLELDLLPVRVLEQMKHTVLGNYETAKALIEQMHRERSPTHWQHFCWLAEGLKSGELIERAKKREAEHAR